ncbi:hypothetical protein MSG28_013499 [Choristoneura fumiferana]|uniref:Uncharacterized protein n=1 Tax=Choristoneura fumiferana TaxID=7141 RepID=A0ACC0KUJ0_CHOFU|nr:hypothetical protein MSG28_013499 [Choristoneura fumiferana]
MGYGRYHKVDEFGRTMPNIVFNYFPVKALGEPSRLLLAYGGEGFEDKRISPDNWPAYKPSEYTSQSRQ